MTRAATLGGVLARLSAAGLLLVACSDDERRAPVQPCSAADCGGPSTGSGGPDPGEAGAGNAEAGAAGVGGQSAAEFVVTRFESDTFDVVGAFTEAAQVRAEARGGGFVDAAWNGSSAFALPDLLPQAFVLVAPSTMTDALPTLLQPALGGSPVELPVVRASVIDSIVALSTLPLELLPGRAQVVLRLTDAATQAPIPAARLTEATAESIVYAAANSWSDAVDETDARGLALLVNVAAEPWPGRLGAITVSGSALGSVPLRTVSGAVTYLDVRLSR